ncbi:MAG: hypothetical protein K8R65_11160 [Nitrospirae bacterium]|nr:hypothetical protein [Nitrospirota bacterium]
MKGSVATQTKQAKQRALDCCHRCGGLMVSEHALETGTVEWHCVMCGDRVDRVILARRQQQDAQQETDPACAGSGHARLN